MLDVKKLLSKICQRLNSEADYIVAQGTSDGWTFRKWNSGIAECWKLYPAATYNCTSQSGNGYYTTTDATLPSGLFTSITSANVTRTNTDGGYGLVSVSLYGANTTRLQMFVFCTSSGSYSCSISCFVTGRWK